MPGLKIFSMRSRIFFSLLLVSYICINEFTDMKFLSYCSQTFYNVRDIFFYFMQKWIFFIRVIRCFLWKFIMFASFFKAIYVYYLFSHPAFVVGYYFRYGYSECFLIYVAWIVTGWKQFPLIFLLNTSIDHSDRHFVVKPCIDRRGCLAFALRD